MAVIFANWWLIAYRHRSPTSGASSNVNVLLFIAGLVALVIGASALVRGASKLALSFGISPLVVGLTIVAFGTSAPEVAVSAGAVLGGQTDIAVGNVVGSNIFNVLFILGISALITPLVVDVQLIRQEVPIMVGASLLLLASILLQAPLLLLASLLLLAPLDCLASLVLLALLLLVASLMLKFLPLFLSFSCWRGVLAFLKQTYLISY